jgi:hypothetical protein
MANREGRRIFIHLEIGSKAMSFTRAHVLGQRRAESIIRSTGRRASSRTAAPATVMATAGFARALLLVA